MREHPVVFVSVVRDFDLYARCVKDNPFCAAAEKVAFDNRERNESIPVLYNRFLASRPADEEAWYVFCHEDWQLKEELLPRLRDLDRNALYGPIGVITKVRFGLYCQWYLVGAIEGCRRDGTDVRAIGHRDDSLPVVDTFDCQCLIVHSSCLRRAKLGFDEHLTYDLYLEDLCIAARERCGIFSRVLQLDCRHWSASTAQARYYVQKAYLDAKYPLVSYTGTSSWSIGGSPSLRMRLNMLAKKAYWRVKGLVGGLSP